MGQTILITGASSGIGYELAKVCGSDRHNLILVARREERLKDLKADLEAAYGIQVWTYQADLTDAATRQQLFAWTQAQGLVVDSLVNNAGFGDLTPFFKGDWDKQNAMIQLNITALTHLTHLFLPNMVQRGQGHILNLASTAAFLPGPFMSVYYASKAFVLSFSQAIATELNGTGVSVTCLCPGPTQSEFQEVSDMGEAAFIKDLEGLDKLPTAAEVAAYGYQAMMQGKQIAVHGLSNKVLTLATRLLPRQAQANVMKKLQAPG